MSPHSPHPLTTRTVSPYMVSSTSARTIDYIVEGASVGHHLIQFRYDGDRPDIYPTGIELSSLDELFSDADGVLSRLSDRSNIFYTLSSVTTWKKREFECTRHIGFDIDPISKDESVLDAKTAETIARVACEAAELDYDSTGVVLTGHGIQLIIELDNEVTDKRFYSVNKSVYDGLCAAIDAALLARSLPYRTDRVVFDAARLFRMPNTVNAKPHRAAVPAVALSRSLRSQSLALSYDYENTLAFRLPESVEFMNAEVYARTRHLTDTQTVLSECAFLVDNAANASTLPEPRWFREAGLLAFMPDGDRLFHERSLPHPNYSQAAAQQKLEQVRARQSGPVSCQTISACWGGCQACAHYGRVKYPVHIQPPNVIPTEQFGFYKVTVSEGAIKRAVVQPDDLVRKFEQLHPYRTVSNRRVYAWIGTHYEIWTEWELTAFAEKHLKNPMGLSSTEKERREFAKKVLARNVCSPQWIEDSVRGKINLKNGVLDIRSLTLYPHSMDCAFTSVLPYEFDSYAVCPTFEQFVEDLMCGREDLKEALLEYLGYCISFDEPWLQKAALFIGEGANGKSTLMNVVTAVIGKQNVSNVELQQFSNPNSMIMMVGKAINISRECSPDALDRSEVFKKTITGEPVDVKYLYDNQWSVSINAKHVILGNDMPKSSDKSRGLSRRFLLWPFEADYTGANRDPFMEEKLLKELPGILNRLLRSYKNLKARGSLSITGAQKAMLEQYELENDNVYMFMSEKLQVFKITDPQYQLSEWPKQSFYDAYREFCESAGTKPANEVNFWKRMRRRVTDLDKRLFKAHGGVRKVRGIAFLEQ